MDLDSWLQSKKKPSLSQH